MNQSHVTDNEASRQRLQALIASLDDEALQRTVFDDWTVGAILAHMAFWDRSVAVRWDEHARSGNLEDISAGVIDVVNAANLPTWRALPGKMAAELAMRASEEVDARLRRLSDEDIAFAVRLGRPFMVDRSGHRTSHLDQIEAILGR